MTGLPLELFFEISKYLKFTDIVNLCSINSKWERYCGSSIFQTELRKQISPDKITDSLFEAITGNNISVLINILNYGIDVNVKNEADMSALHLAIEYDKYTITKLLLEFGANPNITSMRFPILIDYTNYRDKQMVKLLLQHGADPNINTEMGLTSLHFACHDNYVEIVEVLLKYSANPNIQADSGNTPLIFATDQFNPSVIIVQLLLEYRADPNIQDKSGNTPLFYAANNNNIKIVDLLLQNGSNPNIQNNDNDTILFLVSNDSKIDIPVVNLLLKYGGKM